MSGTGLEVKKEELVYRGTVQGKSKKEVFVDSPV